MMESKKLDSAKKAGRPQTEVDWDQAATLAGLQCTHEEIAAGVGCSVDTLHRACLRENGIQFADFYKSKRVLGHISLRRKMWMNAEKSGRMQIFLSKNWLGFADRVETMVEHSGQINGGISQEKMEKILSDPESAKLAQELALRLADAQNEEETPK